MSVDYSDLLIYLGKYYIAETLNYFEIYFKINDLWS